VADAFVQDPATGSIFAALGFGSAAALQVVSNHLTPDWELVGAADINQDGHADAIVQQQSTGTLIYADMADGTFAGWQPLASLPADMVPATPGVTPPGFADLSVGGTGDADGDGIANVFLQDTQSGAVYVGGLSSTGAQILTAAGQLTPEWTLAGAADLNGDGFADVVAQDQTTGTIVYGNVAHGAFGDWHLVTDGLTPDWHVAGLGDVNGDGFADVVVQNSGGVIQYANMAGGTLSNWGAVADTPGWTVQAVADLNGDGNADVVIRGPADASGYQQLLYADMHDGALSGWGVATTALNADWQVKGVGDINNDGFTDIIVQQQSTGAVYYAAESATGFAGWHPITADLGPEWHVV
jgi:hypothetical protein